MSIARRGGCCCCCSWDVRCYTAPTRPLPGLADVPTVHALVLTSGWMRAVH